MSDSERPPYRDRIDSGLERELLQYTLDTGSPVVRELKPLLFPIADNILQCRAEMRGLGEKVGSLTKRVTSLEATDAKQVVEANRWKWWLLGILGPLLSAAATLFLSR